MSPPQDTLIIDRLFEPMTRIPTSELARQLASLRADPVVQDKIDSLAHKCNEGRLTPEERAEYKLYVSFIDFMGILQAKARRFLADACSS
jgi:hypothetical protein